MKPLVSVIVPTYNRLNVVCRALQSIVEQTYRPIEVIIVDDCSNDGTADYIQSLCFSIPVRVVTLLKNEGPGFARNAGLACAKGKYVAFLDSDDWWAPYKLERQVAILEAINCSSEFILYSPFIFIRKYGEYISVHRDKRLGESLGDYMFVHQGHIQMSSVILNTALARSIGFNGNIRLHEDWDFYLRLEEVGADFIMYPQPLGVVFDLDNVNRASSPRPAASLEWLNEHIRFLSQPAFLSFRAKMAPQLRDSNTSLAMHFIVEAYMHRAIGILFLFFLIGCLLYPDLRNAAYWLRGKIRRRPIVNFDCLGYEIGRGLRSSADRS